jgi:pantothenate synthetase
MPPSPLPLTAALTVADLRERRRRMAQATVMRVGFVPTMGALA